MNKMKLHIHKYKELEGANKEICIRCGKIKGLPFFPFGYAVLKLTVSCWFWKVRGLQSCPYHGFHAQSLINGYCKECERSEWAEKEIKESEEECKGLMY